MSAPMSSRVDSYESSGQTSAVIGSALRSRLRLKSQSKLVRYHYRSFQFLTTLRISAKDSHQLLAKVLIRNHKRANMRLNQVKMQLMNVCTKMALAYDKKEELIQDLVVDHIEATTNVRNAFTEFGLEIRNACLENPKVSKNVLNEAEWTACKDMAAAYGHHSCSVSTLIKEIKQDLATIYDVYRTVYDNVKKGLNQLTAEEEVEFLQMKNFVKHAIRKSLFVKYYPIKVEDLTSESDSDDDKPETNFSGEESGDNEERQLNQQ